MEALRKKKMEWEAASRSAKSRGSSEVARKEPTKEELSSDDDSEEIFAVDWRAQHLWCLPPDFPVELFLFFNFF